MNNNFGQILSSLSNLVQQEIITIEELINIYLPLLLDKSLEYERNLLNINSLPHEKKLKEQYLIYTSAYAKYLKLPKNKTQQASIATRISFFCDNYAKYLEGNKELINELILLKQDGFKEIITCYRWFYTEQNSFFRTWHKDVVVLINSLIGGKDISKIILIPKPIPIEETEFYKKSEKHATYVKEVLKKEKFKSTPSIATLFKKVDMEAVVKNLVDCAKDDRISIEDYDKEFEQSITKILSPVWAYNYPNHSTRDKYLAIAYYNSYKKYLEDGVKGTLGLIEDYSPYDAWEVIGSKEKWFPVLYWSLDYADEPASWGKEQRKYVRDCIALVDDFIEIIKNNNTYKSFHIDI